MLKILRKLIVCILFSFLMSLTGCTFVIEVNDIFIDDSIYLNLDSIVVESDELDVNFVTKSKTSDLKINYSIESITTDDNDFSSSIEGEWLMTKGETKKTFVLNFNDDAIDEANEEFKIRFVITHLKNNKQVLKTKTVTLIDNDPDTTPPSAVTGFKSDRYWDNLASTPIMTWNNNSESDLSHYEIELRLNDDDSSLVTWTSVGNTTYYQFKGLMASTSDNYYANIRAIDTNGNVSTETRISAETESYWTYFVTHPVSKISAGKYHICAIASSAAFCWGAGTNGQLGHGLSTDSNVPEPVSTLNKGITSISSGKVHSCAVQAGAAFCWGEGGTGRMGTGTTADSNTPVAVSGLNTGVSMISAADLHSCAIQNGAALCWGSESDGRLGNNTSASFQTTPQAVSGLASNVTSIVTGYAHTCAIVNGGVQCWGDNSQGQLGDGNSPTDSLVPVPVNGLTSGVTALAVGKYHSCALVNGGVKCWGFGNSGQLGNNDTANYDTPQDVTGLTENVHRLSNGGEESNTTCAVKGDVTFCWGAGTSYQLGNQLASDSLVPVIVNNINEAVNDIATGFDFSCFVLDGKLKCVGDNTFGQLGDNSNIARDSLVYPLYWGYSGIQKIVSGKANSCLIHKGALYCWGNNDFGQLGTGSTNAVTQPTLVSGLYSGVEDVVLGDSHSCALIKGGVKCWGLNSSGQLGNSSTSQSLTPVDVTQLSTGVQNLKARGSFTCAIKNGGVKCWGKGDQGQIGNALTNDAHSPTDVSGLTSAVEDLALANQAACATSAGALKCWGDNDLGQLGMGSTSDKQSSPTSSGIMAGMAKITGGENHFCALVNGSIQCWGQGDSGQLGDGNQTNSSTPVIAIAINAYDTSGGRQHSCALVDNRVQCWGDNTYGQLGDGSNVSTNSPVQISAISYPVTIEAGYDTSCFIWNFSAYCWGKNDYYQIGDGTNVDNNEPQFVNGINF